MATISRRFDFQVAGKGFLLAKSQGNAHSWHRTGRSDSPSTRSSESAKFGVLPDELDHPEAWSDWSGGYGHAYRRTGENTYHWAENFDARFPRQLVHCQALISAKSTTGTMYGNIENFIGLTTEFFQSNLANGQVLAFGGGRPVKLIASDVTSSGGLLTSTAFTPTFNLSYGFRAANYGSFTYIPNVNGSGFWQLPHYSVGVGGTSGPIPGTAFAVEGNRLWRAHGPARGATYLQNIANTSSDAILSAPNWSATLNIGTGYGINDLIAFSDQVCVGMPDGVYVGDSSGTFVNVFNELSAQAHPDNCRDLAIYKGALVAQHVAGVFIYQQEDIYATLKWIGPPTTKSVIQGRIRALTSHGDWLYGGLWTGSESHIIAGRPQPNGDFAWHTLHRLPAISQIHRMFFDGIELGGVTGDLGATLAVPERFWVATNASAVTTGSASLYVSHVPRINDNPLASDPVFSANYVGSARIDLGSVDWDSPGTPKNFRAVEIWADNLASSSQWCQVLYDVDHSGSFTLLGTVAKSPKDTLYFPTGEGSFVTGQSIELSLRSFTASSGVTPVYRSMILRGNLLPRSVDLITAQARIADGLRDRQGGEMRSAATMIKELRDLANPDANVGPHQLIDLTGAVNWVKLIPPVEEQEVWQQGEDYPEVVATVKMAVLTYS